MKMALPKDIPTLESTATKNYTRVDNVFCSEDMLQAFVKCNTDLAQRPNKTDHLPILSTIDITPPDAYYKQRRNFRQMDWEEFTKTLETKLTTLQEPTEIDSAAEFYTKLEALETMIQETIAEHVPITRPCPHSKRWWTKELSEAKAQKQKLARKSYEKRAELPRTRNIPPSTQRLLRTDTHSKNDTLDRLAGRTR